jgi:hypothetical protein
MLQLALLVPPQLLSNADAVYYTAPISTTSTGSGNVTAKITRATFINTANGAITLTVGLVPPQGTLGSGNTLINAFSIPANQTFVSPELAGLVIPAGYTLHASAGTANDIVIVISGLTVQ